MEEREKSGRLSPEIYVYATNKNFLNLYDALRIDKIKLEIAGYDPNTNRQTGHANAWLDVDDVRLLSYLVCQRSFAAVTGGSCATSCPGSPSALKRLSLPRQPLAPAAPPPPRLLRPPRCKPSPAATGAPPTGPRRPPRTAAGSPRCGPRGPREQFEID